MLHVHLENLTTVLNLAIDLQGAGQGFTSSSSAIKLISIPNLVRVNWAEDTVQMKNGIQQSVEEGNGRSFPGSEWVNKLHCVPDSSEIHKY